MSHIETSETKYLWGVEGSTIFLNCGAQRSVNFRMSLWSNCFFQNTYEKLSGFLPCVVRAEIFKTFCSYYGRNDGFINSCWNLLTFSGFRRFGHLSFKVPPAQFWSSGVLRSLSMGLIPTVILRCTAVRKAHLIQLQKIFF